MKIIPRCVPLLGLAQSFMLLLMGCFFLLFCVSCNFFFLCVCLVISECMFIIKYSQIVEVEVNIICTQKWALFWCVRLIIDRSDLLS